MERHRCKLCYRRFSNGRALGGHMRSHATTHAVARIQPPSCSGSSSSFSAAAAPEDRASPMYGLREHPKKSFRLADMEFSASFAAAAGSSSIVQDGESDAESSLRRRPKRHHRGASTSDFGAGDAEPLSSSVSDASPEEDVARSLMLLSRDKWSRLEKAEERQPSEFAEDEDEEENDDEEDEERRREAAARAQRRKRTRYQCGNCHKVFRSYQALGGHRASHKRVGVECVPTTSASAQIHGPKEFDANAGADRDARVFQCPYCFRVFSSGQALGGHKRSHFINSAVTSATSPALVPVPRVGAPFIPSAKSNRPDLNLPAPIEEEAELSAVSVAMDSPYK